MAGFNLTSPTVTFSDINFGGGLNTAGGPLSLKNNESPDLQNIDFTSFGSVKKRNGYAELNSTAITGTPQGDGLQWFEYESSGSVIRKLIKVAGGALYKMDDLDGTWDDITGGLTITATNHCDFTNFLNEVYVTNGEDVPFKYDGSSASAMTVPTGLTDAKYNEEFENYLFLANVVVSATVHQSRIYWSTIKDTGTWSATDFIDISKNDGQQITRIKKMGDRLVVFKDRSIYNVFFTGQNDIPFIVKRSNSTVGCISPWSIQEAENGLFFLSYDGFYFYDGINSYKISEKITPTLEALNVGQFDTAKSWIQQTKNRYCCALPTSGQTENDRVLVFDYLLKAWSLYVGMDVSAATTIYVDGVEERPYFSDYDGFTYRNDFGADDYPEGTQTAINGYYYTNWRHYGDLINKKGIPEVVIYYQNSESTMTFAYTYDFTEGDQYTSTFSMSGGGDTYGSALYDEATYAKDGGDVKRRDLTGRGRLARFKFENSTIGEDFQIDGMGTAGYAETNV